MRSECKPQGGEKAAFIQSPRLRATIAWSKRAFQSIADTVALEHLRAHGSLHNYSNGDAKPLFGPSDPCIERGQHLPQPINISIQSIIRLLEKEPDKLIGLFIVPKATSLEIGKTPHQSFSSIPFISPGGRAVSTKLTRISYVQQSVQEVRQ
jgi:hypothetical protein